MCEEQDTEKKHNALLYTSVNRERVVGGTSVQETILGPQNPDEVSFVQSLLEELDIDPKHLCKTVEKNIFRNEGDSDNEEYLEGEIEKIYEREYVVKGIYSSKNKNKDGKRVCVKCWASID